MNVKSQADILSAVIIVIITLGLISTAYLWAAPAIQKKLDAAIAERVYKSFDRNNVNSLPRKIEYIAAHGGEESFDAVTEGIWTLNTSIKCPYINNSIQFSFVSTDLPSNISEGSILISGKNEIDEPTLGMDNPSAVYANVDKSGDRYDIAFKTQFIGLKAGDKTYKIVLVKDPSGSPSSVWKTIKISRDYVGPDQTDQNLIITKIKILLV